MDVPNPVPFSLTACSATGSSMVTALERAKALNKDFHIHNMIFKQILLLAPNCQKWEKPPNDFVKVKVDAACRNNTMSYGIIIRDCAASL
ncbi:hypothetical protein Gotur_010772, partial [Gossypium turneri]